MIKFLSIALIVILTLHGLIHLMGLVAYWPLGKISELPYKTTLLSGRWEIGAAGTRFFSVLWLLSVLGFTASALVLALGRSWWAPVLLGTALLSLAVCILDWQVASWGARLDVVLLLLVFLVFGLRVKPAPLQAMSAPAAVVETIPLPAGLPAPVARFYRQTYGDRIPVYHSAILTGRGSVRLLGITFPGRLRFSHISGQEYRHYIEVTFYGLPILKVNEFYLDGHNRLELPFAVQENDPGVDSAANQGLWSETLVYPAFLLTDPRVHWEPIDDTQASLHVPYGPGEQVFTIQFDPLSGEMTHYETIRYHDAKSGTIRWWGDITFSPSVDGQLLNKVITAIWEDEGTPWLSAAVEELQFNADLSDYIHQRGP
ncbi:MAG TPA: DUF6544 family protein [Anaerolineales bacterium]|nr:DUF6544 family protein [Anaerolineales bacterium]